jgi:hypothetical protein
MKPRGGSRSRSGTVEVAQVHPEAMATARKLARRPGVRPRVVDARTVLVENVPPWERNPS